MCSCSLIAALNPSLPFFYYQFRINLNCLSHHKSLYLVRTVIHADPAQDNVAVKPEVANLYLKVMETIFKANETYADNDIKRTKENLYQAESKLVSLEEKYVLNEIEKDSCNFMKPKFKAEIKKLLDKLDEMSEQETNHSKYLSFGVNLIQNLSFYYENASLIK